MLLELRAENYAVIDRAPGAVWPGAEPADGRDGRGQVDPDRRAGAAAGGQGFVGLCAAWGGEGGGELRVRGYAGGAGGAEAKTGSTRTRMRMGSCCGGRSWRRARGGRSSITSRRRWGCCGCWRRSWRWCMRRERRWGRFDQAQQRMLLDRFGGLSARGGSGRRIAAWRETRGELDADA